MLIPEISEHSIPEHSIRVPAAKRASGIGTSCWLEVHETPKSVFK